MTFFAEEANNWMNKRVEISYELEIIKPDTLSTIAPVIKDALDKALSQSALNATYDKNGIRFEQSLPTAELSLLVSVIQLIVTIDPYFISKFRSFIEYFLINLSKSSPGKISLKLSIGDKIIEAKNLNVQDSIRVIMDEYDVIIVSKRKD